jgi:hypothetical protein
MGYLAKSPCGDGPKGTVVLRSGRVGGFLTGQSLLAWRLLLIDEED